MNHAFRRNRGKKLLRNAVIAIILVAGTVWFVQEQNYQQVLSRQPEEGNTVAVSFIIGKGESVAETAENLKEKGFIVDKGVFLTYLKRSGVDRKVAAGRFGLSRAMTIPQVAETVTNPQESQTVLTVPEGFTVPQIDARLAELELTAPGEFSQAVQDFSDYEKYPFLDAESQKDLPHKLEGYLFPDTYFLDPLNYYNENLIQLMLNNFEAKTANIRQALPEAPVGEETRSLHELMTMASILQHEVHTQKDLPIVSGILWKRLDSGWMLGADATLLYLKDDRTIDYFDLQEDSPYNTRNRQGLPPGPIGNPGLKHIEAAMNPQESPYWFYLTTLDTGEVIYGATSEEHSANKVKYL